MIERNTYETWDAVRAAAIPGSLLWYHAPLDRSATPVRVLRVFKNGKLRLRTETHDTVVFTADAGHVARFRRHPFGK